VDDGTSGALTRLRRGVGGTNPHRAQDIMRAGDRENSMLDIVMLALGLGLFAAAVGYTYACERL
jgi:hypothetical protein